MRTCSTCGDTKLPDQFIPKSNRCRDCNRTYQREWRRANREKGRNAWFKHKYGITLDEYQEMLVGQDYECLVCPHLHREEPREARLVVDHNHKTGEVRGLLCHKCNAAAGLLGDEPGRVLALYTYLKEKGHYG